MALRTAVYRPPSVNRTALLRGSQNPVAPPAPPGVGTPPSTPTPSQIPGTGTYLQQQALANQAYERAQADINYRRGQMYSEFGLLPNGSVDPASQFGKYQQMLGSDSRALNDVRNSQTARGLGNLGLGGRVMQSLRDAQGAEHFGFQQALLNNLHSFDVEGLNAQQKLAGDMLGAQQGQEQWDFEHNQFTPAVPAVPSAPTNKNITKQRLAQHLASKKRRP